jgi:hypothetical protein
MDVERAASKGHGILSLFDWGKGKKSKKRLFGGTGGVSPTPGKQMWCRRHSGCC